MPDHPRHSVISPVEIVRFTGAFGISPKALSNQPTRTLTIGRTDWTSRQATSVVKRRLYALVAPVPTTSLQRGKAMPRTLAQAGQVLGLVSRMLQRQLCTVGNQMPCAAHEIEGAVEIARVWLHCSR